MWVRWRVHFLNCCISFKTGCLLFPGYLLLFTGCLDSYEVFSPKPGLCGSDIFCQEENFIFGKFTWDLNRRNCFRDVGLHLMKYRLAINKSIQCVPVKVNEFKTEKTLEMLGIGDQLFFVFIKLLNICIKKIQS